MINKKILKNTNGFTLVELLATITILGLLTAASVVVISEFINKAKEEYYTATEKEIKLAAESYVQNNRNYLPKTIGQSKKVYLKDLKTQKYIGDVKDYSKKSCDEDETYVQIYKESKTKYSYKTYLVCPSYTSQEITS